jgi:hypothetical protein
MASSHSISGLMKWLHRDPWREAFQVVLDRHLGPACDEAGIEFDDLVDLIGADMVGTLWGCAFEDFLTHDVVEFGNIVDDYLKRRGWNEKALDKAYIAGLRSSVMSIYEVSDVRVGESLLARDLFRGGEPVRVSEGTATRSLKQWDRIAARLVKERRKVVFGGGLLALDQNLAESLIMTLRRAGKRAANEDTKVLLDLDGRIGSENLNEALNNTEALHHAAPLISTVWLSNVLKKVQFPTLPEIYNSDGEEIVFVSLHYPLRPGVTVARVREALDRLPDLQEQSPDYWNWLAPKDASSKHLQTKGQSGLAFISTLDDGSLSLGSLEMTSKKLVLSVNSESRAELGRAMLAPILDGLVGEPLVERQDLERALDDTAGDTTDLSSDISPEEQRRIVHESLDTYYREQLDEPIPALGDISPRQAMKSVKGREKLVDWLKLMENHVARHKPPEPMAGYDSSWLWKELGIEDRRT